MFQGFPRASSLLKASAVAILAVALLTGCAQSTSSIAPIPRAAVRPATSVSTAAPLMPNYSPLSAWDSLGLAIVLQQVRTSPQAGN